MASDYLAKFVVIGFYSENQEVGTAAERQEWSDDVFERYNAHIVDACQQAGLEVSEESRSIMAVMATMAPGGTNKSRAGRAVTAYLEYRGV